MNAAAPSRKTKATKVRRHAATERIDVNVGRAERKALNRPAVQDENAGSALHRFVDERCRTIDQPADHAARRYRDGEVCDRPTIIDEPSGYASQRLALGEHGVDSGRIDQGRPLLRRGLLWIMDRTVPSSDAAPPRPIYPIVSSASAQSPADTSTTSPLAVHTRCVRMRWSG